MVEPEAEDALRERPLKADAGKARQFAIELPQRHAGGRHEREERLRQPADNPPVAPFAQSGPRLQVEEVFAGGEADV